MNRSDEQFFARYQQFLEAHDACADSPEHFRTHVVLPQDGARGSVTFTCSCGARVVLAASHAAGRAIVAAHRQQGIPVVEGRAAYDVH